MIWLVWRQHRLSILAGLGTLAVLAAFLVLTGRGMWQTFDSLGLDRCTRPTSDSCPDASAQFQQVSRGYQFLIPLFLILPALAGVFWGAPLVAREIEQGTHRLVWTQSITRRRWLTFKVALLALVVLAGFAAITGLTTWWTGPLMAVRPQRFDSGVFDLLGIVPAAYALGAFAIGVAAGTFTRRLVPAIGITLIAFLVLRVGVDFGLRPHYMAPLTTSVAFSLERKGEEPLLPAGWIIEATTLDSTGRLIGEGVGMEYERVTVSCPELAAGGPDGMPDPEATSACAQRMGFHVEAIYQPEDRYWRFQLTEAAIYVVLSGALIAGSGWWLRRRVT